MRIRLTSRTFLLPAGIAWAAVVACGSAKLLNYDFTPGAAGKPTPSWPADCSIRPDGHSARLVMIAHPHCPCTRASIAELAHIMAHTQKAVVAYVLFYRPRDFPRGWERTDLWRSAAAIPGVAVLTDVEGREAQRFGAVTSGHVLLYDRTGQLMFSGGITGSRGHVGDNAGCDRVIRLLTRESIARTGCPSEGGSSAIGTAAPRLGARVYGCPIQAGRMGSRT